MRLSIKKHNAQFLQTLAEQMGIDDLSEALNYLLLDIKGLGYSFGNTDLKQSQSIVSSVAESIDQPIGFERHKATPDSIVDPVIARIASLIEEF